MLDTRVALQNDVGQPGANACSSAVLPHLGVANTTKSRCFKKTSMTADPVPKRNIGI